MLADVKQSDDQGVYYAGKAVAGLPLEAINGDNGERPQRQMGWTFIYGDCDASPSGPFDEGGCATPLQIQVFSTCRRWFSAHFRERGLYEFRGAKATGGGGRYELAPMEIFTGRSTVVIFANEKPVLKAAARQLREVHSAQPPSRLPPPAPGSLRGKLPCQVKPG